MNIETKVAEEAALAQAAFDAWIGKSGNAESLSPIQRILMGAVFFAGYFAGRASADRTAGTVERGRVTGDELKQMLDVADSVLRNAMKHSEEAIALAAYVSDLLDERAELVERGAKEMREAAARVASNTWTLPEVGGQNYLTGARVHSVNGDTIANAIRALPLAPVVANVLAQTAATAPTAPNTP